MVQNLSVSFVTFRQETVAETHRGSNLLYFHIVNGACHALEWSRWLRVMDQDLQILAYSRTCNT